MKLGLGLLLGLAGCSTETPVVSAQRQWSSAMQSLSLLSMYPQSEAVRPGDAFLYVPPGSQFAGATDAGSVALRLMGAAPCGLLMEQLAAQGRNRPRIQANAAPRSNNAPADGGAAPKDDKPAGAAPAPGAGGAAAPGRNLQANLAADGKLSINFSETPAPRAPAAPQPAPRANATPEKPADPPAPPAARAWLGKEGDDCTDPTATAQPGAAPGAPAPVHAQAPARQPVGRRPANQPPAPQPPAPAFEIGNGYGAEARPAVRLQQVAVPKVEVARFTHGQLGAAGVFGNFGASIGLNNDSRVGMTLELTNLQSLGLNLGRVIELLHEALREEYLAAQRNQSERPALAQRLRFSPARVLQGLRQASSGRQDYFAMACRGDWAGLNRAGVRLVLANEVMYAGGVDLNYFDGTETAARVAVDLQNTLPAAIRRAPSVPDLPAVQEVKVSGEMRVEEAQRLLQALQGAAAPANTLAGVQAAFGVGTARSVTEKRSFDRPVAVGFAAALQFSVRDALLPISEGEIMEAYMFCREEHGRIELRHFARAMGANYQWIQRLAARSSGLGQAALADEEKALREAAGLAAAATPPAAAMAGGGTAPRSVDPGRSDDDRPLFGAAGRLAPMVYGVARPF